MNPINEAELKLALMTGVDIPIPNCHLVLHQPTLKEISIIGEETFFVTSKILCLGKHLIEQLANTTIQTKNAEFNIVLEIIRQDKDKKNDINNLFVLLFPEWKISFTPRSFVLSKGEEIVTLDENNYTSFQTVLKRVLCFESGDKGNEFNTVGSKGKAIAEKLLKARQRVAAQKAREGGKKTLDQYISTIVIGVGSMSLQDTINLTLYQLYDLLERYQLWVSWDCDIRARLAGANIQTPVIDWMKQIH